MKKLLLLICLINSIVSFSQKVNIIGRVYYDNNRNNKFDGNDSVLVSRKISASRYPLPGNSALTNSTGVYLMPVDTGSYTIAIEGSYNNGYRYIAAKERTYRTFKLDTVDFAIQIKDTLEELSCSVHNINGYIAAPSTGSTQQYSFSYRYDGSLPSLSATITLDFNPMLKIVSSSMPPFQFYPGHLAWKINAKRLQYYDSLFCTLSFPPIGDTISTFDLQPKITPDITASNINSFTFYSYGQNISFPPPQPIGSTRGIKWLRTFAAATSRSEYAMNLDTSQDGKFYYITGNRTLPSNKQSGFVAKLTKDGLSVWEKYLSESAGYLPADRQVIKHTLDGGCVTVGNILDSVVVNNRYSYDVIVSKFTADGNKEWQKRLTGARLEGDYNDIVQLPNKEYLIVGETVSDNGDFTGNKDTTKGNLYISKLSETGNVLWTKTYGGSGEDMGYRIVPLKNGSYLILGATSSNDGDVIGAHPHSIYETTSYYTSYNTEAWILNVDVNGNMLWNKCYGGSGLGVLAGAVENEGGILLTGGTDSKDGDLLWYPEKAISLWILQISNTGAISWSKSYKNYIGYQDSNYVRSGFYDNGFLTNVRRTKDGNYIVGGSVADKYGTIKSRHGLHDFLLVKFNQTGDILWQKAIGGTKDEEMDDIIVDNNDDVVFIGNTSSSNDDLYDPLKSANSVITVAKVGITNVIKGQVFIDDNGNGVKDAAEHFYNEGKINSVKGPDTVTARIFNGAYLNNVDTGTYVTSYIPVNNYYIVSPDTHNTAFTALDQQDSVSFALVPKPDINDLKIQMIPLTPARPGFTSSYRIITKNAGTQNISNVIISLKKDTRQSYVSANRPYAGISGDSIWWAPRTLSTFEIDTLDVVLKQAVPPNLQNGDTLLLTASSLPVINDTTPVDNRSGVKQNVQGSYDPNDKGEMHGGYFTPQEYANGDYLQYLIRFQNTGTDTAFFVTVKDTLENKLNISTLEMVSSSHPYTLNVSGNIATWNFSKINLADSTTNERASHGYILFKVKPLAGLKVGDAFDNKAAIYFDYNLPVETNVVTVNLNNPARLLPVDISSFTAILKNNVVPVSWKTASEVNSDYFIIEKSTNAVDFKSIGTKKAEGNADGSVYGFTDLAPSKGVNYYRLRMVDKDGHFTYSPVVIIYYNSQSWSASVSPNPNNGHFVVRLYNWDLPDGRLRVTDINGKIVFSKTFRGNSSVNADISSLSKGIYIIDVDSGGHNFSQKIMVQ